MKTSVARSTTVSNMVSVKPSPARLKAGPILVGMAQRDSRNRYCCTNLSIGPVGGHITRTLKRNNGDSPLNSVGFLTCVQRGNSPFIHHSRIGHGVEERITESLATLQME